MCLPPLLLPPPQLMMMMLLPLLLPPTCALRAPCAARSASPGFTAATAARVHLMCCRAAPTLPGLPAVQTEMRRLEHVVQTIHIELQNIRRKEERMRDVNGEGTSAPHPGSAPAPVAAGAARCRGLLAACSISVPRHSMGWQSQLAPAPQGVHPSGRAARAECALILAGQPAELCCLEGDCPALPGHAFHSRRCSSWPLAAEATNTRVAWFNILAALICCSLSAWQLWYLNKVDWDWLWAEGGKPSAMA